MSETFLAYKRVGYRGQDVELETAVDYDYVSEIDARNGWTEPGEQPVEDKETDIQEAARAWSEFFQYCFSGVILDGRGRGMALVIKRFVAIGHHLFPTMMRVPGIKAKPQMKASKGPPIPSKELAELVRSSPKELRALYQEFRKLLAAPKSKAKVKRTA